MKILSILFLSLLWNISVRADDFEGRLAKARSDKAVAEQANGYLKAVTSDAATKALVEEVNKKRKDKYKELMAKTQGATLEAVEQAAGKQLMEKYK